MGKLKEKYITGIRDTLQWDHLDDEYHYDKLSEKKVGGFNNKLRSASLKILVAFCLSNL